MSCVTDYSTGWQLCGIAVNPVQVGQPVVAGFTLSAGPTQIGADDFAGVVVNDAGQVIATFPSQPAVVPLPLPPALWLQFTSDEPIGPDEAGRQIVVYLGPTSLVGGYGVGDTFPAGLLQGAILSAVATVQGSPSPSSPPSSSAAAFALGQPVIQGTPQAGGTLSVIVGVTNEGNAAGDDVVSGVVLDLASQTTIATLPSRDSGSVQPGQTVNVTLSATLPASAAGVDAAVLLSDAAGNTARVEFTVPSPAPLPPTTPPSAPPKGALADLESWWAGLSAGQRAAVLGGGTLFLAGTAMALGLALERR